MSIVRLYNCPYFINGECSLRSHDNPPIDYWNSKYIVEPIIPHCPKGRAYCHVDVDTDKWSKGTLELIRILVKDWRRKGRGNAGEIVEIIEQILRRRDDMGTICMTTEQFGEEKQKARQEGREEAWDLARRIFGDGSGCYNYDEIYDAFDTRSHWQILGMPVEEVLSKDEKHQKKKKALHVGDEVKFAGIVPNYKVKVDEAMTGYVVGFEVGLYGERSVRILAKHGSYLKSPEMCEKTGKHNPDIEKVMATFEEEESE